MGEERGRGKGREEVAQRSERDGEIAGVRAGPAAHVDVQTVGKASLRANSLLFGPPESVPLLGYCLPGRLTQRGKRTRRFVKL